MKTSREKGASFFPFPHLRRPAPKYSPQTLATHTGNGAQPPKLGQTPVNSSQRPPQATTATNQAATHPGNTDDDLEQLLGGGNNASLPSSRGQNTRTSSSPSASSTQHAPQTDQEFRAWTTAFFQLTGGKVEFKEQSATITIATCNQARIVHDREKNQTTFSGSFGADDVVTAMLKYYKSVAEKMQNTDPPLRFEICEPTALTQNQLDKIFDEIRYTPELRARVSICLPPKQTISTRRVDSNSAEGASLEISQEPAAGARPAALTRPISQQSGTHAITPLSRADTSSSSSATPPLSSSSL